MKEKIALGLSIIFALIMYFALEMLLTSLELQTRFDDDYTRTVNYGRGVEETLEGGPTDLGYWAISISGMLAWRVYHWILTGKVHGNIPKETHLTWLYWLLGMTAFIILETAIGLTPLPVTLKIILIIAWAVVVFRFSFRKCTEEIAKIKKYDDENN